MELTLGGIAQRIGARAVGDPDLVIRGVAGIREAEEGEITFLANPKYEMYLEQTRASAVIVSERTAPVSIPHLIAPDPYHAFLAVLEIFTPVPDRPPLGVDASAVVAESAVLGEGVAIGPHAVIEPDVRIGDRTVIMAGSYVGHRSRLGADCLVYPNVVVREDSEIGCKVTLHPGVVIGSDGFGFSPDATGLRKIPQIGHVVVEDDVEIGANSTVDRATVGVTRIRTGSRIDNLVHIAHNVEIGERSILCAQVGISGSTRLGEGVTLAGQAGLVGHIEIGPGARVGAQGGVTKSIPAGESVSGYPAMNHARAQRAYAALRQLPGTLRQFRELTKRLEAIERILGTGPADDLLRNESHADSASGGDPTADRSRGETPHSPSPETARSDRSR